MPAEIIHSHLLLIQRQTVVRAVQRARERGDMDEAEVLDSVVNLLENLREVIDAMAATTPGRAH